MKRESFFKVSSMKKEFIETSPKKKSPEESLNKSKSPDDFFAYDSSRQLFSDIVLLYKIFSDLNRIKSRTLLDLVTHAPERDSIRIGKVTTDTTHIDLIFSRNE